MTCSKKILLDCAYAAGDVVMLTAAVRDLHRCYPGRFLTDVRSPFPEVWANNRYLTPLEDGAADVTRIECSYPLINRCNTTPQHCLNGYIDFLNERLGLKIRPTEFKGDIHLSAQEKLWYSQVHELTGEDTPFWIVCAGGKHDVTIKWWQTERYQEVIHHFRGRIQFVQIGAAGNFHPKLDGAVDLRGQTDFREFIRLVYHSQGVLCSVTSLMHLAAAVETRRGRPKIRPCVVVAGGREPAHWEAYPGHQFIHNNGALSCCSNGACWKDRTFRLNDGDERDRPENLCSNTVGRLPRCMDMIAPQEVIRRIETYFAGGAIPYLTPRQAKAAERGVIATQNNEYDRQPLNIHFAGVAVEQFIASLPSVSPSRYAGRGIVICGGGTRYFTCAWVCIKMLRALGCTLPIQLWHLGEQELDIEMNELVAPLDVECVDAAKVRKKFPVRMLRGWPLKPYALLHSRFREVLLLDADNVPVANPEYLFDAPEFKSTGAIFWPDFNRHRNEKTRAIWRSCGLRAPAEHELESGQILVDKQRCWRALRLCLWFNENADFYYQHLHGDKDTFHLAFRKLKQPYSLVPTPIHPLAATMCQHDFQGRRVFQHRNLDKWDLFLRNRQVRDFWFESECRSFIQELRGKWPGIIRPEIRKQLSRAARTNGHTKSPRIVAAMISCEQRNELRRTTLHQLQNTDWDETPLIEMDDGQGKTSAERQVRSTRRALEQALERSPDYILFLEDDLLFNRHLRHNLYRWSPLKVGAITLAGLYNPGVAETECDVTHNVRVVHPHSIFGSQAFLISRSTAEYLLRNWNRDRSAQDLKMARLAARLRKPIFYHAPSLVQHVGVKSVWGGHFHQAKDFDPDWKAL